MTTAEIKFDRSQWTITACAGDIVAGGETHAWTATRSGNIWTITYTTEPPLTQAEKDSLKTQLADYLRTVGSPTFNL